MKAREIKQLMLERYQNIINAYEYDIGALAERRAAIRIIEQDLKTYFGIEECYKFEFK